MPSAATTSALLTLCRFLFVGSLMISDGELARRSVLGYGILLQSMGRGQGLTSIIDRPNAIGSNIPFARNFIWFDAAVIPYGEIAPEVEEGEDFPHCIWSTDEALSNRVLKYSMPIMGAVLSDLELPYDESTMEMIGKTVASPSMEVFAGINIRAYDPSAINLSSSDYRMRILCSITHPSMKVYGMAIDNRIVAVAMSLAIEGDLSIQYVATEKEHRGKGLASQLVAYLLYKAKREGLHTATLQATSDGMPIYQRLGFEVVGMLRAFTKP